MINDFNPASFSTSSLKRSPGSVSRVSVSGALPTLKEEELVGGPRPHGGQLTPALVSPDERDDWLDRAADLPSVVLNDRELADLECIAVGAFSPLEGFLGRGDYQAVVSHMRLSSGLVWSLPVTLSVRAEDVARLQGDLVSLRDSHGETLAILHLEEIFSYDREEEAEKVFGTSDPAHPGVAALLARGEWLLGGKVSVLQLPRNRPFIQHRITPPETRLAIRERGWRTVVGFQTRNPIHRAHEYLTKCALEITDGLLLHPLVGETKEGDTPADLRVSAYETLLANYYPRDRVLLSVFPAAMRYAGPREALFHAICRKNYGCTHFIVGRDHAGVGDFYGSFDAHDIFTRFDEDEIGITPLFFDHAFFCKRCGQMATTKTCPHSDEGISLSGTEVRRRLNEGQEIPPQFSRPEVAAVLRAYDESGR